MAPHRQTNQHLGYPADARLLIVNADDFGMCHAVNEAISSTLKEGIVRSTSLMGLISGRARDRLVGRGIPHTLQQIRDLAALNLLKHLFVTWKLPVELRRP